jgi:hypothetical protein
LDSHLPKNEAIQKAFDQLNQKIGGQAQAYLGTYAGQMELINVKMESAKETIGGALLPVLTTLMSTFGAILDVIKPILPELTLLIGAIGTIIVAAKAWTLAQTALNIVLNLNPIMLVVTAIGLLVAAFIVAWNHSKTFRDIVIEVAKAGVEAFGWLIGAVGDLVVAWMKIVTGPMKLMLEGLSHLPIVGGAAKAALKDIGSATNDVSSFFDGAKKKVDSYASSLDDLAKKKVSIGSGIGSLAGGGVSSGNALDITGLVPGGDITKGASQASAAAKKQQDALAKAQTEIQALYDKQDAILKDRQDKMDSARADYEARNTKALEEYEKKKADIQQQYADKAAQIEQAIADKRQAIIQQSIDALTTTWENATKIDVSSLFTAGGGTAEGLVSQLQDQLAKIQKLQADAGQLHAAGYSQAFIDQVVSKGPEVGDQMAQAILNASPQTQSQISSLFDQINMTSQTGLDALAQSMNDGTQFATQKMADQYAQLGVDLQTQLATNKQDMDQALADAQTSYQQALVDSQNAFDKQVKDINASIDKQLTDLQAQIDATLQKLSSLGGIMALPTSNIPNIATLPTQTQSLMGITNIPNVQTPSVPSTRTDNMNASGVYITQNITTVGTDTSQITAGVISGIKYGNPLLIGTGLY